MQKKSENKARPGGSLFSSLIKSFWGIRDEVSPMEALLFALIPIGLVFLIWVFFIAEFILVFYISKNTSLENIAPGKVKTAFIVYSIVNGRLDR